MHKAAVLALSFAALTGCDIASDVAGDVIADEVRTRYLEQCQTVAENAGIGAARIGAACECSADRFADDLEQSGELQINRDKIREVLEICVQEDPAVDVAAPAEE